MLPGQLKKNLEKSSTMCCCINLLPKLAFYSFITQKIALSSYPVLIANL